jgi:hypothetical protein
MDVSSPHSISFLQSDTVRRWISRAFIVSILVYLVVLGYLIFESVTGASKWAPYGVSMPLFVGLIVGSELVMLVTAVQIFREDSGIWPPAMSTAWARFKNESKLGGALDLLSAGWDISIIDLRLRTGSAVLMGRLNRVASIVPLAYAMIASAGGAPWGLRGSALFDIAISLVVWAFMELVMVKPQEAAQATSPAINVQGSNGGKEGSYSVRQVQMVDLDRLEELEKRNWKDQAASREVMAQRIKTYPEGQIAAVYTTTSRGVPTRSKVVAWCSVMPANDEHVNTYTTWDDLTSHGKLSACDPDGDVIVGVNLTSVTEGGTYILLAEILASVVDGGKDKLIGGSRLTGFVSFNQRRKGEGKEPLSADNYARLREIRGFRINEERVDAGEPPLADDKYRELAARMREEAGEAPLTDDDALDYVCSNVRGYMSIPGTRLVRVVADYFRDPASADYGVIIEWPNPIPRPARQVPFVKQFVAGRIREEIAAEWEQRKQRLREHAARRHELVVPAYLQKTNGRVEDAEATEAETGVQEETPAGGA